MSVAPLNLSTAGNPITGNRAAEIWRLVPAWAAANPEELAQVKACIETDTSEDKVDSKKWVVGELFKHAQRAEVSADL